MPHIFLVTLCTVYLTVIIALSAQVCYPHSCANPSHLMLADPTDAVTPSSWVWEIWRSEVLLRNQAGRRAREVVLPQLHRTVLCHGCHIGCPCGYGLSGSSSYVRRLHNVVEQRGPMILQYQYTAKTSSTHTKQEGMNTVWHGWCWQRDYFNATSKILKRQTRHWFYFYWQWNLNLMDLNSRFYACSFFCPPSTYS